MIQLIVPPYAQMYFAKVIFFNSSYCDFYKLLKQIKDLA